MKLRSSLPSPFGRKVTIVAMMLGLVDRIEMVPTDTLADNDPIRGINPLGKVPCLELDDGRVLYDSRVICEYLDLQAGGLLFPADPTARMDALTLQALGDGLMDASILQRYEVMFRDAAQVSDKWLGHQRGKVARALATLEAAPPAGPLTIGHVALACALGYLDLRFEGLWRKDHPKLVAWLDAFSAQVPAFEATRVKS